MCNFISTKKTQMIRLKSKFDYTKGRKLNLPIVGKVQFNDENIVEIEDDEIAHQLVDMDMGLQMGLKYVDESLNLDNKKVNQDDDDDDNNDNKMITKEHLRKLNMAELKENCSPFPEEEWSDFRNKKDFIDYLFLKLNQ